MKNLFTSLTSRSLFSTVILGLCCSAAFGQAQKGKPSPTPTPAQKSVTFGYCAAGDTACESANRLRSDANRAYVGGTDVAIDFFPGGSNDITLNFSRNVIYDFTEQVAIGNPTPSWVSQPLAVKPFINVLTGYNAKLLCGSAPTCDIDYQARMNGGGFTIGRVDYRVQWNPESVQPWINVPYVTSYVNVHYVKTATEEYFVVTPKPDGILGKALAGLQGEPNTRTTTAGGQYVMPFTLTIKLQ